MEQRRKPSLLIAHSKEKRITPDPLEEGCDLPAMDSGEGQPWGNTPRAKAPAQEHPMDTDE